MCRTLYCLSTELVLKIFQYLNISDLCNLRQTCKRFDDIISSWDHVLLKNITTIVTNQKSDIFLSRCQKKLNKLEQIRVEQNWLNGSYKENSLLFTKQKYMPWLSLTNESVWFSRGSKIFNYKRNKNSINVNKPNCILSGKSKSDIARFQVKNDHLVSGSRDGAIFVWSVRDKKMLIDKQNCHNSDINSVDISLNSETIVSGSRDNCFKVWKQNTQSINAFLEESHVKYLEDRVWTVSLSDQNPLLAIGTAGVKHRNSILVYDIERLSDPLELQFEQFGSGVLELKWDGPNTLWSCGYDTYLRRWDTRTGRCEQIYRDPCASALYCLDYDYYNSIMVGTQLHGRVILWDTRQKNCVQFFFMETCKNLRNRRNSPVYGVSFDAEFLFTATDQNLNVLDFSTYNGKSNDYSYFMKTRG